MRVSALFSANMTENFLFALGVTGPILIVLVLGTVFRRGGLIDDDFVSSGNKLVFSVALPCLLFFSTATASLGSSLDLPLVVFGCVVTVLGVVVLSPVSRLFIDEERRGVFVQGAFRGNMAVIGIALVVNAYGDEMLAKTSVYVAILSILYNLLSVWVLRTKSRASLRLYFTNPIMVAVVAGMLFAGFDVGIPDFIQTAGSYLSALTLPLALLCVGGSLNWSSFRMNHMAVIGAAILKLVILPGLVTAAAIRWGFRGQDLGLLFMMNASPSAAASYIMAKQMTRHGAMAAEIIAVTTSASVLTITGGIILLKSFGYL